MAFMNNSGISSSKKFSSFMKMIKIGIIISFLGDIQEEETAYAD